jgi:hypothetical protein
MDQSLMIKIAANVWLFGISLLMFTSLRKIQKFFGVIGFLLLTMNVGTPIVNKVFY